MKLLIVFPAYNEAKLLPQTVTATVNFCRRHFGPDLSWRLVIADNGSTDQTAAVGQQLAEQYPAVSYVAVPTRGKGAAIRAGWQSQTADRYCFMDADLATDLSALPLLLAALAAGADVAIGSRFHRQSQVKRSITRRLISQGYRLVLHWLLRTKISDAPCGFKAINQRVKDSILPQVKNNVWFFDSELVLLAERAGYRVTEVPVRWADPREGADKSRVPIVSLSRAYLQEILALRRRFARRP